MPRTPISTKLDAKQIDKVQKLINLANNNPNEHEANLAARNACKMLDGYLFPVTASTTPPTNQYNPYTQGQQNHPPKPPSNPFDDIFRATGFKPSQAQKDHFRYGSWEGFDRTTTPGNPPPGSKKEAKQGERETKSEPHQDYGQKEDPFADFKKAYAEHNQGSVKSEYYDEVYADDFWDNYYDEFLRSKKQTKGPSIGKDFNFTTLSKEEVEVFTRHTDWERNIDKRILKCAMCQKSVKTGYPGEDFIFVCMQCELKIAAKRR